MTKGTDSLIVPIAGVYRVSGTFVLGANVAGLQFLGLIYQNGSSVRRRDGGPPAGGFPTCEINDSILCAAGDIITLEGWQASGAPLGNQTGSSETALSLELVSI
jgi:hypothetical protein